MDLTKQKIGINFLRWSLDELKIGDIAIMTNDIFLEKKKENSWPAEYLGQLCEIIDKNGEPGCDIKIKVLSGRYTDHLYWDDCDGFLKIEDKYRFLEVVLC